MSIDLNDPRLTAFALNDPSLTEADRAAIEAAAAAEPNLNQAIADIRQVGELVRQGLQAEQQTIVPASGTLKVAIGSQYRHTPHRRYAPILFVGGVAASLLLGFGLIVLTFTANSRDYAGVDASNPSENRDQFAFEQKPLSVVPEITSADAKPALRYKAENVPSAAPSVAQPSAATMALPALPTPAAAASEPFPGAPALPGVMAKGFGGINEGESIRPVSSDERKAAGFPSVAEGSTEPRIGMNRVPDEAPGGRFDRIIEMPFTKVEGIKALSTFGVDVDTASYAIVRRFLQGGTLPPPAAVRLEEIVNYFPYQDLPPEGDDPFAVRVELSECPWQPSHKLARIALKAKPIKNEQRPPSNLVFLIDVSGSMYAPNRLPLVKQALKLLVNQLGENDRVAIVVYAGNTGVVLDSTSAANRETILAALDRLQAGGSTNGAGGIQQAYEVAVKHFQQNGTNRVILCTDGDFNVGTSSTAELVRLIEDKRKTGVFLSVFGFGMGNLRDEMMVKLAGHGNGNYAYIDTLKEANKALVEQVSGTLVTVAKDVKIQIEFNPAVVGAYRLLGYEKRALAAQDFHDDQKDAGEMGAGHVVTAFYELVLAGTTPEQPVDGLRYQPKPEEPEAKVQTAPKAPANLGEAFVVKMRYKKPEADESTYRELPVANKFLPLAEASEDFRFGASAASFALLLQNSTYKGNANFGKIIDQASQAMKFDPSGYRAEFLEVVRQAQRISGQP